MRSRARVIIIGLTFILAYGLTFSFRPTTDTTLNSLSSRELALHGDVDLSRFKPAGGFYVERGSHTYSIYGVGISIIALPVYAILTRTPASESVLQGTIAVLSVTLATIFMLLLLAKRFDRNIALCGTIVFAFGTTLWPTASTALWQQGPVAALETGALLFVFSEREGAAFWAGVLLGATAFVRLPLAVVTLIFFFYFVSQGKRAAVLYIGGVAPFLIGKLIENRWLWGALTNTGYSNAPEVLGFPKIRGLLGELFSWRRGLFVYSPFLILAVVGILLVLRRPIRRVDRRWLAVSVASSGVILLYAGWSTWWGGTHQYGYRYLLDGIAFLVPLSCLALQRNPKLLRVGAMLAVVSVFVMAAGSVPNGTAWDTDTPQGLLSVSPLSHALSHATSDPTSVLWRVALVGLVVLSTLWALESFTLLDAQFPTE